MMTVAEQGTGHLTAREAAEKELAEFLHLDTLDVSVRKPRVSLADRFHRVRSAMVVTPEPKERTRSAPPVAQTERPIRPARAWEPTAPIPKPVPDEWTVFVNWQYAAMDQPEGTPIRMTAAQYRDLDHTCRVYMLTDGLNHQLMGHLIEIIE